MRLILIALFFFALFSTASAQQAPAPQWAQELDSLFAARYNRVPDSLWQDPVVPTLAQLPKHLIRNYHLPATAVCRYSQAFSSKSLDSIEFNNISIVCFEVPGFSPAAYGIHQWTQVETREVYSRFVGAVFRPGFILVFSLSRELAQFFRPEFGLYAWLDRHFPQETNAASAMVAGPGGSRRMPKQSPALSVFHQVLKTLPKHGLFPRFDADSLSHPVAFRMAWLMAGNSFKNATGTTFVPIASVSTDGPAEASHFFVQFPPFEPEHGYTYFILGNVTLMDRTVWQCNVSFNPVNGFAKIKNRILVGEPASPLQSALFEVGQKLDTRLDRKFARAPLFPHPTR